LSKTDNNKQCFTNFTELERNCSVWSKGGSSRISKTKKQKKFPTWHRTF
jgi:hypothetical protein